MLKARLIKLTPAFRGGFYFLIAQLAPRRARPWPLVPSRSKEASRSLSSSGFTAARENVRLPWRIPAGTGSWIPPSNTPPRPSHFAGSLPQPQLYRLLWWAIIKGLLLGDINSNAPVKPLP